MSNTGALVNLENEDGGSWWAEQQGLYGDEEELSDNERPIYWTNGPATTKGKLDSEFELTVTPSYAGVQVGTVSGNVKDGLKLSVNLMCVKGRQLWYWKNGNELWTHIDLHVTFGGNYEGDYKIETF